MKKTLLLALAAGLAFPAATFAQTSLKIGTVDMQRAFKEYNKTRDAESKVNDAKTAAKATQRTRSDFAEICDMRNSAVGSGGDVRWTCGCRTPGHSQAFTGTLLASPMGLRVYRH